MKVEAYAKVNLTLEVFGERSDGYHALRSVVMPISLADTLEIEPTADGTISSDTGYADDLCVRAAKALRRGADAGRETRDANLRGARISVTKRIPVGGGLGGGSADAAATLVALNVLWKLGKSREQLAEIGAQVGSDVPSLVLGGPVLMEGRGEKVTRLELGRETGDVRRGQLDLVLVNPGVPSSTKEVYAACSSRLPNDATIVYNMQTALAEGSVRKIALALMNDLQEPAVRLHPEIAEAMASLREAGAEGVLMSGSGSTVFGLVPSEARGREIAASLAAKGYWARSVHSVCPVPCEVCEKKKLP